MTAAVAGALSVLGTVQTVRLGDNVGERVRAAGDQHLVLSQPQRLLHRQECSLLRHRCVGVASRRLSRSLWPLSAVVASQAEEAVKQQEEDSSAAATKTSYHFLIANAKFMLDEEEHFQELLKERLRKFGEDGRKQDFWLVIEPKFLQEFPDYKQRLSRPAVALVSTDAVWITFMKLRLDRVLKGSFETERAEEALTGNPVELHFDQPQKWTAPYPKYQGEWWTPFLYKGEA